MTIQGMMMKLRFSHHRRSSSSSAAPAAANDKHATPAADYYSASSLRSESMTIQRSIDIAELMFSKWNPDVSGYAKVTSLFHESRKEALEFIKCVASLQKSMHLLALSDTTFSAEALPRAQMLMQIAMKRLQKEFYQILSTNRAHLDPESVSATSSRASVSSSISDSYDEGSTDDEISRAAGDSISDVEQVSMLAMENLRCIAECMISSGYGKECVEIYNSIRKSIVDEGLYKLTGIEIMSPGKLQKLDWEIQEMKIINWLNSFKIAIKTLFRGERILCDSVFGAAESIRESCFTEISKDGASLLFGFPEMLTKTKKLGPEKIFRALDMYAAIVDNWAEIESTFSSESSSPVRFQALNSLAKLAESVRTMLTQFERSVQKDSSTTPPPDGGVHTLTNHVMNYLSHLADHEGILSHILADCPPPKKSQLPESHIDVSDFDDSTAPSASVHMAWLILLLVCKLDSKSKQYKKNVALSYLFLANNLGHIIGKVRTSNLKYKLGEDWISRHEEKVRQFASKYEELGWMHVYAALPEHPASIQSIEEVTNCFEMFNRRFEEAYKKQRNYVIPDSRLRDEIKAWVSGKIVGKYREFYEMHKNDGAVRRERTMRLIIRFEPEDIEHYISESFFGDEEDQVESRTSVSSVSSVEPVADVSDPAVIGISFRFSVLELVHKS